MRSLLIRELRFRLEVLLVSSGRLPLAANLANGIHGVLELRCSPHPLNAPLVPKSTQ